MSSRTQQAALTALAASVIVTLGATMLAVSTGRAAVQALAIGMALSSTALGLTVWSLDPGTVERCASRRALAVLAPILLYAFGAGVAVVEGARRTTEASAVDGYPLTFAILAGAAGVLAAVLVATSGRTGDRVERAGADSFTAVTGHAALGFAMSMTAAAAAGVTALLPAEGEPRMMSLDAVASVVIGLLMAGFAGYLLIEARRAFVLRPSREGTPRPAVVRPADEPVPLEPAFEGEAARSRGPETAAVEVVPGPSRNVSHAQTSPGFEAPAGGEPGQKPAIVAKARARRGRARRR